MPKYIIFSYDYPPNNGGISRLCGEIRKELLNRGKDVLVITSVAGPSTDDIIRVSGRRGILEFKMRQALKKHYNKGDIVITDTWHPAGTLALTVTKNVYILAHGAELLEGTGYSATSIWKKYRRKILRKAAGVISNSDYTNNLVQQIEPKANGIAIPLAIDAVYFHPTVPKNKEDDILRICSLSRLEKFKGHDFLINTIAQLPLEYKNRLRLEIGGKGSYKEKLEDLVKTHRLEDVVSFLGFMPDDEVMDFYSRNDIFVLLTREEPELKNVEGFGLVFAEAQACGTAVIGTNTGGIPSAVSDGNGGWLIEQNNEEALTALLQRLIDNKTEAQSEGLKARQRVVNECNWAKYCDRLITFTN